MLVILRHLVIITLLTLNKEIKLFSFHSAFFVCLQQAIHHGRFTLKHHPPRLILVICGLLVYFVLLFENKSLLLLLLLIVSVYKSQNRIVIYVKLWIGKENNYVYLSKTDIKLKNELPKSVLVSIQIAQTPLKCIWTEIYFYVVIKFSLWNARFQTLRRLG